MEKITPSKLKTGKFYLYKKEYKYCLLEKIIDGRVFYTSDVGDEYDCLPSTFCKLYPYKLTQEIKDKLDKENMYYNLVFIGVKIYE